MRGGKGERGWEESEGEGEVDAGVGEAAGEFVGGRGFGTEEFGFVAFSFVEHVAEADLFEFAVSPMAFNAETDGFPLDFAAELEHVTVGVGGFELAVFGNEIHTEGGLIVEVN